MAQFELSMEERKGEGEKEENKERLRKERGGHVRVEVSTRKSGQVGREYPETHEEEEAEARRARDGWRKYRREWVCLTRKVRGLPDRPSAS